MRLSVADDLVKSAVHDIEQTFIDFAFAPEKALAILNPFEIAYGDAASVAENVGDGEDALAIDDGVGLPCGGAVSTFAEDFSLYLIGVALGDLVFDGGRNGDVARLEEHV